MAADESSSRYPYLISVRGGRPVPARRDGSFCVCAHETQLGLWWPRRAVQVLDYDPRRGFSREERQAHLDTHPEAAQHPATLAAPAYETEPTTAASTDLTGDAPALWEWVASRPVARPVPPRDAELPASRKPGVGW